MNSIDEVFSAWGLPRGRSIGDAGRYYREQPEAFFLPGARVCVRSGIVWTGALDLTSSDGSRLREIARQLGMTLFVHTHLIRPADDPTVSPEAIVTADAIEITTSGLTYICDDMRARKVRITRGPSSFA